MTRAFVSPPRYVQSVGAVDQLGAHVEQFGSTALVITDDTVHEVLSEPIEASFAETEAAYHTALFGGECTEREITRLSESARERAVDVVVGAGGGKAVDLAKAVRERIDGALISLPTVASTDAPTSSISVLYSEDSRLAGGIVHDRRPDLVLVDTEVVAAAPVRWFVSGIGDALATRFEAAATAESGGQTVAGGSPTRAGLALATRSYDVVRDAGPAAVEAVSDGRVTDAVEEATEAIILLSGLGFENGGLAAAHAIHDGIASTVETDATHGEKVCFGLLAQLVLESRETETLRDVAGFASGLGLPVTLDGIGATTSHVDVIANAACRDSTSMCNQPGRPTPAAVADALLGADELGQSL